MLHCALSTRLENVKKFPLEFTPEHAGQLGLGHSQDIGCLLLGQMPILDDFPDSGSEASLHIHGVGFRAFQIPVNIGAAFFNGGHDGYKSQRQICLPLFKF